MAELDSLRREAYTGSDRCWPCTVLNLALVGLASLWLARRDSRLSGLVAAVGVAAIALRGYVVPYTPTVAPRLVEASPVPEGLFKTAAPKSERGSLTGNEPDGETVFRRLLDAGVVETRQEMVVPGEEIQVAWDDEMDRLAALSLDELADVATPTLPAESANPTLTTTGSGC